MDNYKKLMAVKGLIISLEEERYKIQTDKRFTPKEGSELIKTINNHYYKAIVGFLNREENNGQETT